MDVTPVLTSAGILGVAIGFGAQNLVKDFLSGMFMMLEDQYGVGDVVDLGPATGTVEAVGLRITTIRDTNGTVWYVRNGEILRVGNSSQGFAVAVVDLPLSYGANLAEATQVLDRTAREVADEGPAQVGRHGQARGARRGEVHAGGHHAAGHREDAPRPSVGGPAQPARAAHARAGRGGLHRQVELEHPFETMIIRRPASSHAYGRANSRGGLRAVAVVSQDGWVGNPVSFFEPVGGEETFHRIVARFYKEVKADEILRPLYPEEDLGPAEERLRLFLMQYWGGPHTYSDNRGHPRLRMRHVPFKIGPIERDAWLRCMRIAVDEAEPGRGSPQAALGLPGDGREQLDEQLFLSAHHPFGSFSSETNGRMTPRATILRPQSRDRRRGRLVA